jgi:hypothetical protein
LKPAQANSLQDHQKKKKKKAGKVTQGVGPEFKPQYKKKSNYKTRTICANICGAGNGH